MQKKIISILAVVLLMTAFFAGCVQKEETAPEMKDTATQTETSVADTDKPQATPEKTEETGQSSEPVNPVIGLVYGGSGFETKLVENAVMTLLAMSSIQIDVNIQEASSQSGAAEFDELVQYGCNLIFVSGIDEEYVLEAAGKYPEIYFEIYGGAQNGSLSNVSLFKARFYQQQYLNGMIAGFISQSGNIGYIAPNAENTDIRRVNAFALGAKEANPEAVVHFAWMGEAVSYEETLGSITQKGCDVLIQCSSEEMQTAFAYDGIKVMSNEGEGTLPIIEPNMFDYIFPKVQAIHTGSYQISDKISGWFAIGNRELDLDAYDMLTEEQKNIIRSAAQNMADDTWDVFTGPITDSYGQVIIPEGMAIPDEDLLYMLWYVANIEAMSPPMG